MIGLPYRLAAVALAIAAAYGAGYGRAAMTYSAAADLARLTDELNATRTSLRLEAQSRQDADARVKQLLADAADTEEMIDDLASEAQSRQGRDACRLDDSDAARLRAIR